MVLYDTQTKMIHTPLLEKRQRLYYRKYQYAVNLWYPGFKIMNNLDLDRIGSEWYRTVSFYNFHTCRLEEVLKTASRLLDIENSKDFEFKVSNSWNNRFYYFNNPSYIDRFTKVPHAEVIDCREAEVCLPDGVVLLKNPKYRYRTYFRERKITSDRSQEFLKKLNAYGDYFYMNPSTKQRLTQNSFRYPFSRNSFIDYSNSQDRLLLEMLLPGYFGSTMPIQAK